MNNYKRGDIYYANLSPCVGSEQSGLRPVLIVSNDIGNAFSTVVTVAAITSKFKKKLSTHVLLSAKDTNLKVDSLVLLEQLRTIDKQRITGYVGTVDNETLKEVNKALRISLSL